VSSILSPEGGNGFSFQNVSSLKYQTMDKVQKLGNPRRSIQYEVYQKVPGLGKKEMLA
jgi:hypothetical protein